MQHAIRVCGFLAAFKQQTVAAANCQRSHLVRFFKDELLIQQKEAFHEHA